MGYQWPRVLQSTAHSNPYETTSSCVCFILLILVNHGGGGGGGSLLENLKEGLINFV